MERNASPALRDAWRVESDWWRSGLDQFPAGAGTCMSQEFRTDSGRRSTAGGLAEVPWMKSGHSGQPMGNLSCGSVGASEGQDEVVNQATPYPVPCSHFGIGSAWG
jgi:hypothetical protein